jgi:N-acetyl-anhydromuramyl-L-alanine amidase AmpD
MIETSKVVPFACPVSHPSPNKGPRTGEGRTKIMGVVLHATAGSDKGAVAWMQNPAARASCHVHIDRDGTTVRMVPDTERAWHAGVSQWKGFNDVNSITLGWEIGNLNNGIEPYTDLQYGVLAQMAAHYIRQGLKLDDIVGGPPLRGDYTSHAHVARPIGRKNDPLKFDWARFRRETEARLNPPQVIPVPVGGMVPRRVWSDFFGEHLIITRYVSEREWYFVRESEVRKLPQARAQTPLSAMPPARD